MPEKEYSESARSETLSPKPRAVRAPGLLNFASRVQHNPDDEMNDEVYGSVMRSLWSEIINLPLESIESLAVLYAYLGMLLSQASKMV